MRCLHKSALVVVAFETETKSLNFGGEVQHLLAPCRFTFADSLQREEGKRGEVRIGLFSSFDSVPCWSFADVKRWRNACRTKVEI